MCEFLPFFCFAITNVMGSIDVYSYPDRRLSAPSEEQPRKPIEHRVELSFTCLFEQLALAAIAKY